MFNKLETDETVEEAFYPLFAFHEDSKAFTLKPKAVIYFSELYQRLRQHKTTTRASADQTDYKAELRAAAIPEEKQDAAAMISMKRAWRFALIAGAMGLAGGVIGGVLVVLAISHKIFGW